jgi:hypothetical protein
MIECRSFPRDDLTLRANVAECRYYKVELSITIGRATTNTQNLQFPKHNAVKPMDQTRYKQTAHRRNRRRRDGPTNRHDGVIVIVGHFNGKRGCGAMML